MYHLSFQLIARKSPAFCHGAFPLVITLYTSNEGIFIHRGEVSQRSDTHTSRLNSPFTRRRDQRRPSRLILQNEMPYDVIMGGIKGKGSSLFCVCLFNAGLYASVSSACQRGHGSVRRLSRSWGIQEKTLWMKNLRMEYRCVCTTKSSLGVSYQLSQAPQDYFKTL